ncbi:MAG: DUF1573 domain-containing protein [Ferruginibacter sp.]
MKKLLLATFCGLGSFISFAQHNEHDGHNHTAPGASTTVAAAPQPDGISMKEAEYDFGKIPQGKPVTHIFSVTNTSKAAFKLDNVQASCGCTTPVWDKEKTIAPGESTQITVGYNAAAEGPFNKTITIIYNGSQTKVVNIKGEVWKTPAASAPANESMNDLKN